MRVAYPENFCSLLPFLSFNMMLIIRRLRACVHGARVYEYECARLFWLCASM